MLSRRMFNNCLLCMGMGLIATEASGQTPAPTPGVTRKVLSKSELPGSNYDVVQVLGIIAPGALVARHTHPGIESAFVLEGAGTLFVKGEAERKIGLDDSFFIPPETPHALQNGGSPLRIASTYTVERGKPLATPAPE